MTLIAGAMPEAAERTLLARASPVLKLAIALAWLVVLATTLRVGPPLFLSAVAVGAALVAGGVSPGRLLAGLGPLIVAALGIGVLNLVFGTANADPGALELARLGPLRITEPGVAAALGLVVRVVAIVAIGTSFALTTDTTHLVDALVQQLHVPARFAYGALAAYQAVPRLADDFTTIRNARLVRGLGSPWHPRILVGLLVRAIRHADQLATAMDARAFGTGPRTTFRPVPWTLGDGVVALGGLGALLVAIALR